MTSRSPTLPRSIWLLSESRRSTIAVVATLPLAAAAQALMLAQAPELRDVISGDAAARSLLSVVVAWSIFGVLHTVLTWFTYRGLRGAELREAVTADPGWRNRHKKGRSQVARFFLGFGPASWAMSVSILALIAVITMVLRPSLRAVPLALIVAVIMVAVSWLNVAVTYAVHYVRLDRADEDAGPMLAFPGEKPNRLLDYLYFAVGVQATFGSTDVQVRTSSMRELVLGQSLLAFTYNTVIVGMVISLLLGLA